MISLIKNLRVVILFTIFSLPKFILLAENDNSILGNSYVGIGYDRSTSDILNFQHNLYSLKLRNTISDKFDNSISVGMGNAKWNEPLLLKTSSSNTFVTELGLAFHNSIFPDNAFVTKIDPFVHASIGTFTQSGDKMVSNNAFTYLPIATHFPWTLTLGSEFHFFDKLSIIPFYQISDALTVEVELQNFFGISASYFFIDTLGLNISFKSASDQNVFSTSILYDF